MFYSFEKKHNKKMPRYAKRRRVSKRAAVGAPNATARNVGGALGSALGGFIPVPGAAAVGGWLGQQAGGLLSSLWGSGDYVVKTNSLIRDGKPVGGAGSDSVRVNKSEFLGMVTVAAGAEFNPRAFVLNPGDANTFPWLSTIAQCYEEWIPHGILFRFKSTASTNSTSTNLGSITMGTEYDVYDAPPRSKVEMLQMSASTTSSVSQELVFGIECDPRFNPMGIFFIMPPSGIMQGSHREYVLGTHFVVANGASVEGEVGELWIEYDITFQKTQSAQGTNAEIDCWHNDGPGAYSNTNALLNGGLMVHDSISAYPDSNITAYTYYFSPSAANVGEFWCVNICWRSNSTACTYPTVTGAGCSIVVPPKCRATGTTDKFFTGAAYNYANPTLPLPATSTATQTIMTMSVYVYIASESAAISLSGGVYPTGGTNQMALTAYRMQ